MQLVFTESIVITVQPKNQIINSKDEAVFSLAADGQGSDQYTYQWVKQNAKLVSVNVAPVQSTSRFTISSAKSDDSGIYYCIVRNQQNMQKKSIKVFLKVLSEFFNSNFNVIHFKVYENNATYVCTTD